MMSIFSTSAPANSNGLEHYKLALQAIMHIQKF